MQRSVSAPPARLRSVLEDGEFLEGGVQFTRALTPSREKPEWEAVSPRRVSFEERVEAWQRRLGFTSPDRYSRSYSEDGITGVSTGSRELAAGGLNTRKDELRGLERGEFCGDTEGVTNGGSGAVGAAKVEKEMTAVELFKVSRGLRLETDTTFEGEEDGPKSPVVPLNDVQRTGPETERGEAAARKGALWSFNLAMHSDLTVQVNSLSFQVHKSAVCARSGLLAHMTSGRPQSERTRVVLPDLPGGEKTFELVLRFCYGERLHMTPENIAGLRCAAEYLEMGEEFSPPGHLNLLTLTDAFLDGVALRTMTDALKVLLSCQANLQTAEACNLPLRAMEAIADHVIRLSVEAIPKPTGHVPSVRAHASEAPGADPRPPVGLSTLREKCLRQLSKLEVGLFARLMEALKNRGVDHQLVGSLIVLYAQSFCTELLCPGESSEHEEGATGRPSFPLHTSLPSFSFQIDAPTFQSADNPANSGQSADRSERAQGLEVLLASLPAPLDAIAPGSACALLAIARRFSLARAIQEQLEERIIGQLAFVSTEDLVLVARWPGKSCTGLDQNWVLGIVESFLDGPVERQHAQGVCARGAAAQTGGGEAASVSAAPADLAHVGNDVSRSHLQSSPESDGTTEGSPAGKVVEDREQGGRAKRPPWLTPSVRSRVTSLSPEKCASPPAAGVKKPRGKGWPFRGRKGNGTKTTEKDVQVSKSGNDRNDDVGVTEENERQPPAEFTFTGGLSETVTEPRTEGSVQGPGSQTESVVGNGELWKKEGDKNILISPLDVAAQPKWFDAPGETYRGLHRCVGIEGSGESEDVYVKWPPYVNSPPPGLWEEQDLGTPVGGLASEHGRGKAPEVKFEEPIHMAHVSPARSSPSLATPGAQTCSKPDQGLEVSAAGGRPRRAELLAVGRLIDEFMRIVGQDSEFGVSDFCALALCLPGDARADDDGLYVALVAFLKAHPSISRHDEFLVCDCIDWYKLTEAAREDAAASDVIPDHVRMEVLTIEQRVLKERLREGATAPADSEGAVKQNLEAAEAFYVGGGSSPPTQGLAAATEAGGGPGLRVIRECATLKREHQRLAIEGALVKMRLADLERDHLALIERTERTRARGFCGCFRGGREPAHVSKSDQ